MTIKESEIKFVIPDYVTDILNGKTIEEQVEHFNFLFCNGEFFTLVHTEWTASWKVEIMKDCTIQQLNILDYNLFIQENILVGIEIKNRPLFCFKDNQNQNYQQMYVSYLGFMPEHKFELVHAKWCYFGFIKDEHSWEEDIFNSDWLRLINNGNGDLWKIIKNKIKAI